MMRTEDLTKVLPLWIKYTEDVRADPEVCFTHLIIYLNTESIVQLFLALGLALAGQISLRMRCHLKGLLQSISIQDLCTGMEHFGRCLHKTPW